MGASAPTTCTVPPRKSLNFFVARFPSMYYENDSAYHQLMKQFLSGNSFPNDHDG